MEFSVGAISSEARQTRTRGPVLLVSGSDVVEVRQYGPKGAETRCGTKHFKPGAKVYLVDAYWGMGAESVTVVGHHWRSRRLITLAMRSAHLTNWSNLQPAYHSRLEKRGPFGKFGRGSDEGKRKAGEMVAILANTGSAASG